MARILLKNGKIFDGNEFLSGDVLIEEGKIAAIGQTHPEIDAQTVVIDAEGCAVCPALVDIHVHYNEISGDPFGFPALLASVPFGVTAAVDACASLPAEKSAALPIETAALVPICMKDGRLDFAEMEKRLLSYGDRALGVKIYFDVAQSVYPSANEIAEISAFTKARGLLTMVHCTDSPVPMKDIVAALSEGDILTHAYHGAPHSIEEEDYAAYRLAKKKGVVIDAGMAGGVHTDFEVLGRALEKGFYPDTVSTDITRFSAYMRGGIYGLPMCMSIYRALGMPEEKLFAAVTASAARAAKREGKWGALSIGGRADLSVLSYGAAAIDISDRAKHRLTLSQGYTCRLTVKNGQILYRNGI